VARKSCKGKELAIFKGRKPELTYAILRILSNEALIKYDVHKAMLKMGFKKTRYGTVKNKIKDLAQEGYLKEAGVRKTQPGSEGILYEATFKALAALEYDITDFQKQFFEDADEETSMEFFALLRRQKAYCQKKNRPTEKV
jgi:DNA-binding PadR family transcriptional regulator